MSRTRVVIVTLALLFTICVAGFSQSLLVFQSSSPADGETVATNAPTVVLTFNLTVATAPLTVTVTGPSGPVTGVTATPNVPELNSVQVTFASPLEDGAYAVNYAVDPAAGGAGATGVVTFTVDTTAPTLTASSPSPSSTGNPVDGDIVLTFPEQMNMGTVTLTGPSGPVSLGIIPGSVTHLSSTYTYRPLAPLEQGTTYTVDFSSATDVVGNPISGTSSFQFTTVDTTPPTLTSSSPSPGETNVPKGSWITLNFSEAVTESMGAAGVTLTGPSGLVPLDIKDSAAGTLMYGPLEVLQPGGTYTVNFANVVDTSGNPVAGTTSFTFTVAPVPSLVTSTPAAGATGVDPSALITLQFSQSVMTTPMPTLSGPSGLIAALVTPSSPDTVVITPTSPLLNNTTYTVDYSLVQSMYGDSPAAPATFTFTTQPAAPTTLTLTSSTPANGATNVAVADTIYLVFSQEIDPESTVTLRSGLGTVAGISTADGDTIQFIPSSPLLFATSYTLDFSGVRDIYGNPPTGAATITFQTEGSDLGGSVNPPTIRTSAGQIVGVTYYIQNRTSRNLTLTSSIADFQVNGMSVGSVAVPMSMTIPANSTASAPSDVTISEEIQAAARDAESDEIVMIRTFEEAGGLPGEYGEGFVATVSIPLKITVSSSLAAAATVTEVLLDVPQEGKTVARFAEMRGHAFVRGTGSGMVSGTWFVDDQPVETFQINMLAGLTQEVTTRSSLPTQNFGPHRVQLKITRPSLVVSNTQSYIVGTLDQGSQRIHWLSQPRRLLFQPGIVPVNLRWSPMPGAAGYEVAIAQNPAAFGGNTISNPSVPLSEMVWSNGSVAAGKLALLARVGTDSNTWTPTPEQAEKLAAMAPSTVYGAVRVIYSGQEHGDPTTTSQPTMIILRPAATDIALSQPSDGAAVELPQVQFAWQPVEGEGLTYQLEIASAAGANFRALTRDTSYTLGARQPIKLAAGRYNWRVVAVRAGSGAVAASRWQSFVASGTSASAEAPKQSQPMAHTAIMITSSGRIVALPGAVDEISFIPGHGTMISEAQPTITVTYPKAKPETVVMTLNGVDVTALAAITDTTATLAAPGSFNEGEHSIGISLETETGEKLDASSTFTIRLPFGASTEGELLSAPLGQFAPQGGPIVLEWDWNWQGGADANDFGDLVVGLSMRGFRQLSAKDESFTATNAQITKISGESLDITNLLAQASMKRGRLNMMAGDIGSDESALTAGGLTHRAFNLSTDNGLFKMRASKSLGKALQRSSIGRSPDVLLLTAENSGATPQQGLKLSYVDSEDSISGGTGFSGPSNSKVISLSGRTNLGDTGLNLRAEYAKSDSDTVTAFGTQNNKGNALYAVTQGNYAGYNLSATYRRISNDFTSPASQQLTNDLAGWTYSVNRPLGKYVTAAMNYTTLENGSSSSAPSSSILSKSLDLTAGYPNLPYVTLRLARNESASDPFIEGGSPGQNEDRQWSVSMNYAKPKWNTYLNYGKSIFDDLYDVVDPALDTPNDRDSNNWSFGFGAQPTDRLRLRLDWGSNSVDRWFRTYDVADALFGTDGSHQGRAAVDYKLTDLLSSTVEWSKWDYSDALGVYSTYNKDYRVRLNYLMKMKFLPGGGGLVLTGEWRRIQLGGTQPGSNRSDFSILINDSRVLQF